MEITTKRRLAYGAALLPLVVLAIVCLYQAISRYRSHRFARLCQTGNEDLIKESGYQLCAVPSPENSRWYCDPRQLPRPAEFTHADRCELTTEGRRLIVRYLPGA